MKDFVYIFKDVAVKIPQFPFWGKEICLIFCAADINKAVEKFQKDYPEYFNKGQLKPTISIRIICPRK